jgi:hypothetical protein
LDRAHSLAVPQGTVAADGGLVLKLYYRINAYTATVEDNDGTVIGTVIPTGTVGYVPEDEVDGSDASAPAQTTDDTTAIEEIIEEPDAPLATSLTAGAWSLFNLIAMALAAAAVLVCAAVTLMRRKVRTMRRAPLALSLLLAVALIILFFITQDLRLEMALFDSWSIAFAAGAAAAILVAILAASLAGGKKHKEHQEDHRRFAEI